MAFPVVSHAFPAMGQFFNRLDGGDPWHLILTVVIAVAASLGPVLIWLWVWEHEDKHPEPTKLVVYAFLGGMVAVLVALPLESIASKAFTTTPLLILVWAAIEEAVKYSAAYLTTLWRAENHEPIDGMMYMIIAALGFSALENTLFFLSTALSSSVQQPLHAALVLGVNRFFGASIIHILASGTVGFMIALGFHKPPATQTFYTAIGLCTAILLHAGLNLSILFSIGGTPVNALYLIWFGVIALVLLFERVKRLKTT